MAEPKGSDVSSLRWKRLAIRAATGGAGCGIGIALVMLFSYFYMQRPKSWDSRAIRVKSARAEALSRLDQKMEEVSSGTDFTVDVENTTNADITLSPGLTVMQGKKATGALHGSSLKLDREYFLPAHHVVTVSLDNDNLCVAKLDPQNCYNAYFNEDREIVIFDEARKYEIHIPIPPLTPSKNGAIRFRADQ